MTTSRSSTYTRGDVVYVPFQFVDRVDRKARPAVVISSIAYHASRNDIVLAGITSNVSRRGYVGQFEIIDLTAAGLRVPSLVSGIIMTVRTDQIHRQIGALTDGDMDSLRTALSHIFQQ